MMELLQVHREKSLISIDARDAIRKGHHPRQEILKLVEEAEAPVLCEIHVPHKTGPLVAALEAMGLNVTTAELERGHFRLRALKLGD
jgi:hypothetical protein